MALRIVDLTRPLGPSTRVYPGDPPLVAETYAEHSRDGFYARRVCLPEHAGTHVDAPLHFVEDGVDAASIPVERLVAPGLVVGPVHGAINEEILAGVLRDCGAARELGGWILLVKGEPVFSEDSARLLLRLGLAGIGVESLSPDEPPYPVHRTLLSRGVLILENLDLSSLEPCTRLTLFIGMLPLVGGSGAPARVIAILDEARLGLLVLGAEPGDRGKR